jgi:hypothetical protein
MCNAPALTAAVTVMGANMEDPQRCVAVSLAMPPHRAPDLAGEIDT